MSFKHENKPGFMARVGKMVSGTNPRLAEDLLRAANAARADKQGNRSIDILHEGTLHKSSSKDGGFKKRYFALVRSSPGAIVYFEEQSHCADFTRQTANFPELLAQYTADYALGSISLVSSSSVTDVEVSDGGKHGNAFQLTLSAGDNKTIIFACDTTDDRDSWKRAIADCCSGKSSGSPETHVSAPAVAEAKQEKRTASPPKAAAAPAPTVPPTSSPSPKAKAASPAPLSAAPTAPTAPEAPAAPTAPAAPSAPSAPSAPASPTFKPPPSGARGGLLDQIQKGKKLNKVKTVVKTGDKMGKVK